ncbi:MAG TPA: class I SAM-dependent methyltransferase [Terriglobia bacterium]|nr:class I SAM-dependent methyltransferase [Terriglobia bacterium]
MGFWHFERIPEPEEMDAAGEVASYNAAAAEQHLDAIDETFVEHLLRLLPPTLRSACVPFWALDVGSGPAQIPIKLLRRLPAARFVGLDRYPNMLSCARENAVRAGVADRLLLLRADGQRLPFGDAAFPVVICNSVLHHAREPLQLLRELFRVAAPGGAVLVRDLRRPPRLLLRWHLWRHGRRYRGEMRRLFDASVRASYTAGELDAMLRAIGLPAAAVFRYRGAHIGIERPAGQAPQAPFG